MTSTPPTEAPVPSATAPLGAFDLTGRVAVVTGAATGIGKSVAEALAAVGASVVVADLDGTQAESAAAEITDRGGIAIAMATDVSRQAEVDALVAHAADRFGRLDVMANVAGIPGDGLLESVTEEQLDKVIQVNLKGVYFGCQAAARVMARSGGGSIVNVSSAAIDFPCPNNSVYALTKAAVAMLTMSLASELGPSGIRVNAIAPGVTLTHFTTRHLIDAEGNRDQALYDEKVAAYQKMSPIGVVGDPADQALQVLYLASDASRFVTGAILRANGGVGMVW